MKLLARTAACALALGITGCGSEGSDKPGDEGNDDVGETTTTDPIAPFTS